MGQRKAQEELGKAIRKERVARGLSQEGLAFECELHRTYVGSVERGERNVSLENLLRISRALGLRASQLLHNAGL
jgi:transcriptional regulator with XRE-family HTH domain